MELEEAKVIALELTALLADSCERITIAGSIRRRRPQAGDIELLCIPRYIVGADALDLKLRALIEDGVLDYRLNKKGSKVYGAKNKLLWHIAGGIGVDVFSTTAECWPVALVVRTGSAEMNRRIAGAALRRGMKFHAYGRGFSTPRGEIICRTEEDVFKTVGLPYMEPWERG
jgi:DNA polymerase (family 10)